jgi:NADPH:quinone reductase-like Zn-dependent oxidoreductase
MSAHARSFAALFLALFWDQTLGYGSTTSGLITRKDALIAGVSSVLPPLLTPNIARAKNIAEGVILITGANSGIGRDAAAKLVALGYDVHLLCRTKSKAETARDQIGAKGAHECDLSSLASVRKR